VDYNVYMITRIHSVREIKAGVQAEQASAPIPPSLDQTTILLKYTGSTKVDIAAIHASLVDMASSKP
jgi:hypothetical protein